MRRSPLTLPLQTHGPPDLPHSHPPTRATRIPPIRVAKTRAQLRLLARHNIPVQPNERRKIQDSDDEPRARIGF